jgi:hydroxyacylglutathione hydrolase
LKYDSNNSVLKEKILSIKKNLTKGLPTIPSTVQEELNCNIFLRSKDIKTFSKLRDLKDNF